MVENIVSRVSQLPLPLSFYHPGEDKKCRNSVYRFCAIPGLSQETIASAVQLNRVDAWHLVDLQREDLKPTDSLAWVHNALEELHASQPKVPDVFGDFLQVLLHYSPMQASPTPNSLRAILWALSSGEKYVREGHSGDTHDSFERIQSLAFMLLCSAENWFLDENLWPILQEHSVWTLLGASASFKRSDYIALGNNLCQAPGWRSIISDDLPGWLDNLRPMLHPMVDEKTTQELQSVLSRVWDADEANEFGNEKTLVMAFTATAKVWDQLDFSKPENISRIFRLTECTVSTAFCARYPGSRPYTPSQKFRDTILVRLADSVERAVQKAKQETHDPGIAQDVKDVVNGAAELLSKLVATINGDLRNWFPRNGPTERETEDNHWRGLLEGFKDDLEVLSRLFEHTSSN